MMPASSEMHLTMQWSRLNPIELEAGDKLKFGKIPAAPGVYRIQCQMGQKMRVYIGEAGNLKKRIDTYGRVYNISGGRVPPNRRLNRRLQRAQQHGRRGVCPGRYSSQGECGGRSNQETQDGEGISPPSGGGGFHRLRADVYGPHRAQRRGTRRCSQLGQRSPTADASCDPHGFVRRRYARVLHW